MHPAQEGNDTTALAESRFHAANMLRERGALREAEAVYRAAIELWPTFLEALNNLGLVLRSQGRVEEAIECYCAAIAIDPDCPDPHLNLALAHLLRGDFTRGWPEYEWRLRMPNAHMRRCEQPIWDGKPFAGKTILLHPDQGFGDTIHFVRYAPMVKALGGTVLLECQPALARLLQGFPGVDRLIAKGEALPHFDLHAPLLSLPYLFRSTIETLPRANAYLAAPVNLRETWRKRLEGLRRYRIGICWQGNPRHPEFARRSATLESFRELAALPGVQLFSLQKGPGALSSSKERTPFPLIDLEPELQDFADTAAAIEQMDLVVTTDSSVAHLAAALGKPTWVFLQFAADWRWMQQREDSPWYPTIRLFRQEKAGDWAAVFRKIVKEIPEALYVRAGVLAADGRHDEALARLQSASQICPGVAGLALRTGIALKSLDCLEEATEKLEEATRLAPNSHEAWNSLGNVYVTLRRYDEALRCFDKAIELHPRLCEAHINRATLRLSLGDFEQGWEEYVWRLELGEYRSRDFQAPLWNGSSLEGKTILLYAEQGYGDTIQFVRYLNWVKALGARVLLECQPPLKTFLAGTCAAADVYAQGEKLPPFDLRAPLLHLPYLFGTTLGNIPAAQRYLQADPDKLAAWRSRLAQNGRKNVGICWASNPKHPSARRRSIPRELLSLLEIPKNAAFFDFTVIPQLTSPANWTSLAKDLSDFSQTAAALECMDLVIGVDTAVAHLAGALGRPTWLLLPYSAEWRWLTEREDSPWYPSMKLFRQEAPGDWPKLLEKISRMLA